MSLPDVDGNAGESECTATAYELDEFVDGVLSSEDQPSLFVHLAACRSCRERLDAVLAFRRMSRHERLCIPPAADVAFMARLAQHQAMIEPSGVNNAVARRWRWFTVSPKTAVIAATILFALGMFVPRTAQDRTPHNVEPAAVGIVPVEHIVEHIYVFYPGLVIRAVDAPTSPAE